jgi:hypothetical protein
MTRFCDPARLAAGAMLAAIAFAPITAGAGGPPVFWLGGGGAPCNFASLDIAIAAVPNDAIIRIANNQAYDNINLTVLNKAVRLEGGWADCAGTPSPEPAMLNGAPGANLPVLRFEAAGTNRSIRLDRIHLRGGTRSGLEAVGTVDVRLDQSQVSASTNASRGGGIYVLGASPEQTVLRLVRSVVGSLDPAIEPGNTAGQSGGGVACNGARVQLSGARIGHNHSDVSGGGLFAYSGCRVDTGGSLLATVEHGNVTALFAGNSATMFGGGVFASGGAELRWDNTPHVLIVQDNLANRGGGLYLVGAGTRLDGVGVQVLDNTGNQFGGGAMIVDGATFNLYRGDSDAGLCEPRQPCSRISGNQVTIGATTGGSAVELSAATASLRQTVVSGNIADSPADAAFYLRANSTLRLEHSLVHDNLGGKLLALDGTDAAASIVASTVAGNHLDGAVVHVDSDVQGTGLVSLSHSIVWQPGQPVVVQQDAGSNIGSTCLNAHEDVSVPATLHDPGFVDGPGGDYRLHSTSANVDACADLVPGNSVDLVGTLRPVALGAGPQHFDRGALELTDELFAFDFELAP